MMAPKRQTRQGHRGPFRCFPTSSPPIACAPSDQQSIATIEGLGAACCQCRHSTLMANPKTVPWATRHRLSKCSSAQLPSWAKAEAEARCCQACVADFDRRPAAFIIHQDGWNAAAVAVLPRALM